MTDSDKYLKYFKTEEEKNVAKIYLLMAKKEFEEPIRTPNLSKNHITLLNFIRQKHVTTVDDITRELSKDAPTFKHKNLVYKYLSTLEEYGLISRVKKDKIYIVDEIGALVLLLSENDKKGLIEKGKLPVERIIEVKEKTNFKVKDILKAIEHILENTNKEQF